MQRSTGVGAVLAMLAAQATTAGAATVTIYTSRTAWENAVGGQSLTEGFADSQLNPGVSFVSTESGHINPTLECYQDVLASSSQNEPMTTWSFAPGITAYGGNWTLGGPGGSGNNLLVYIPELSLYVGAISNSYEGEFWGFVCDTPFTSVRLVGGRGTNQQNYCLDDMVYYGRDMARCFTPRQDSDGDGDVDLTDFGSLQSCFNGPNQPYASNMPVCACFDDDDDGDVDLMDFAVFQACFNGPNRPAACP